MNKIFSKKSQSELLSVIMSFIIVSSSIILGNLTINETNITGNSIAEIQKTVAESVTVEIFANTSLKQYNESIILKLDNETFLENQQLEFYLNDSLIKTEITDSNGSAPFNPSNASPGIYSVVFQGNAALYLNPSRFVFGELTNETLNITFEGCKSFEEQVLWSSGFSNDHDSVNYQTWYPNHTCSELKLDNCIIKDIELYSRLVSTNAPDNSTEGEGYVQISDLKNCNAPESGKYSEYFAHDKITGDSKKEGGYCRNGKGEKCEINDNSTTSHLSCYGIKTYGSQYTLTDVFFVKYDLCSEVEENET